MKTSSLIALALVLAGCGSSETGSASSSANATRSSAPAATGAPAALPDCVELERRHKKCGASLDAKTQSNFDKLEKMWTAQRTPPKPDDKQGNENWDALALACKFGLDVYTAPECK